jgi:flagellar FliL protein
MAGPDEEAGSDGEAPLPQKKSKKKLILFAGIPAVLLLVGGGLYFSGLLDSFIGGHAKQEQVKVDTTVFYDLPEMLVNLAPTDGHSSYLKLKVALELPDAQASAAIEPIMPRVQDAFQVYLRSLRVEDLDGSGGMFRLKEELLRRVSLAARPTSVRAVLLKEMIVQ